jgi:hypothetical protein
MMFSDSDFQPLDSFELCWRWTEHNPNISSDELKHIRPLSEEKALHVWKRSLDFIEDGDIYPSTKLFEDIVEVNTSEVDEDEIHHWLNHKVPGETEPIVVSWFPTVAVVTEWSLFVKYWDDFCYPGSDDVSVWPYVSEAWSLLYFHEEVFYFGKARPKIARENL